MKARSMNVALGKIRGLDRPKYYCKEKGRYHWWLHFTDTTTSRFHNLAGIYLSEDEDEAEKVLQQFKKNFKAVGIKEDMEVIVLFEDDNFVYAIGLPERDLWIDVNDQFIVKTFGELDVLATSLKMYI